MTSTDVRGRAPHPDSGENASVLGDAGNPESSNRRKRSQEQGLGGRHRATGSHHHAALHLPPACTPGVFYFVFAPGLHARGLSIRAPGLHPGGLWSAALVGGCRRGRMCTPGCGGLGFGAQARAHTPVPCQSAYLFQKRSPNCLSCAPRLCSGSSCATDRAERHRSAAADRSAPSASVVQLVGGSQQAAARAARAHPGRGLAGTAAAPSTGFGCDRIFGCDKTYSYIRLRL